MKLAIVTLSLPGREVELDRCKASVAADLPEGAEHIVLPAVKPANFIQSRFDAFKLAEYVCFVDDDDIVLNGSITKCLQALEDTRVGIAFTNERLVRKSGSFVRERTGQRSYEQLFESPWLFHHLVMYNTSKIPKVDPGALSKNASGGEWLATCITAMMAGAVHLPIIGYEWTVHAGGLHNLAKQDYKQMIATANEYRNLRRGPVPTAQA